MFLNKSEKVDSNKIKFYKYPKEVKCEFTNGQKKLLILEKVIGDSLIFEKYYNQKNYDCVRDSVEKLDIYEKNKSTQVHTLPKKVIVYFKSGTKQKLVLEKMIGDSLFFLKQNGNTQNFDCNISDLETIVVNKEDNNNTNIILWSTISIWYNISFYNAASNMNSESGGPVVAVLGLIGPLPIIFTLIAIDKRRSIYKLNKWKLYEL